jgi:hypothetical protein
MRWPWDNVVQTIYRLIKTTTFVTGILKSFSIILSLYIVFLTVLPCADKYDCSGKKSIVVECNHHHANSDDLDCCSPFCTCNCCHVYSITSLKIVLNYTMGPVTELTQWISENPVMIEQCAVFKPPKM